VNQFELFEKVGYSFVRDLLERKNGLLIANGMNVSGKSYTISGNQIDYGLLQLIIDCLLKFIEDKHEKNVLACLNP
jgi:hypothetical protein